MWFIWVALGLALLTLCGLYTRKRVVQAAAALGLPPRGRVVLRWGMLWLLFSYPVLVILSIVFALVVGLERLSLFTGPVGTWLLVFPFFLTLLIVLQATPYLLVIDAVARVRRIPMHRPRALATLAPLVAFALYTPARIWWEHGDVRWRHHTVAAPGPPGPPPFRIAFVADLQQSEHTSAERLADVIARVNAASPDIVLSGGDWIDTGPDHIAGAARTAGLARSRLGTYSVRGDHEHFAYFDRDRSVAEVTEALASHGVALLHNEARRFDHHGRAIAVAFLTYSYPSRTSLEDVDRLIAELQGADVRILVVHQLTDAVLARARDRVDLILAAHTHGGQVNLLLGPVHVPLARLETRYIDGRYQVGATTIIVTAGVGYSIVPFRYASPGSVETIDVTW